MRPISLNMLEFPGGFSNTSLYGNVPRLVKQRSVRSILVIQTSDQCLNSLTTMFITTT